MNVGGMKIGTDLPVGPSDLSDRDGKLPDIAPGDLRGAALGWLLDHEPDIWYTERQIRVGVAVATGRWVRASDLGHLLQEWRVSGVVERNWFTTRGGRRKRVWRAV